ncbi:MAG: hypothetical protein KGJ62_01765 [Armatimonadetes bacterium]|nr:hypothetical protein [Armatimonadota bacterium]MDE2205505.1 hypothetical protein [Armatimonadota bacterium]
MSKKKYAKKVEHGRKHKLGVPCGSSASHKQKGAARSSGDSFWVIVDPVDLEYIMCPNGDDDPCLAVYASEALARAEKKRSHFLRHMVTFEARWSEIQAIAERECEGRCWLFWKRPASQIYRKRHAETTAEASTEKEPDAKFRYNQIRSTDTACVFHYPASGSYACYVPTGEPSYLAVARSLDLAIAELADNPILKGAEVMQMPITEVARLAEEDYDGRYVLLLSRTWCAGESEPGLVGESGESDSPDD